MTLLERFESKFKKSEGCWNWTAAIDHNDRARFGFQGKNHHASRIAWELYRGPIPDGLFVLHTCDNGRCVNPGHLFLGTQLDNVRDMDAKGRGNRSKKGTANPKAKLTEEDVREIFRLYHAGMTGREIETVMGIDDAHAHRILRGKAWKHLGIPPVPHVHCRKGLRSKSRRAW